MSGGADSFALLHWAHAQEHPIVALTVDHGLRDGSAAEAAAVAEWCRTRKIDHEALVWGGEKPTTGVQEAARSARYRLLCQACERMGISHLFTGHTADDQAETVFMRLRRGAGRGLAGMPQQRKIAAGPGELITLHRIMLSVRRAEARAYAEANDLPFIDDPSNEDDGYERVRVRALLAALEQQGLLTVDALCRTAARQRRAVARMPSPSLSADGAVVFSDIDELLDGGFDTDDAIDAILIALGSSSSRPKRSGEPGSISELINEERCDGTGGDGSRISADALSGMTVNGVIFRNLADQGVIMFREPAALLGRADGTPGLAPVPAPPGSKHLFDRRFIVEVPDDAPAGLELRALGQLLPKDIATSTVARQRVATLPALAKGDELTHLPQQAMEAVTSALAGWKMCDRFLSPMLGSFPARSLLAERFARDVIRF
ncbi:MAG: tRNA lysidine(34) synthetase TilS [Pseudomonadota bacterium]